VGRKPPRVPITLVNLEGGWFRVYDEKRRVLYAKPAKTLVGFTGSTVSLLEHDGWVRTYDIKGQNLHSVPGPAPLNTPKTTTQPQDRLSTPEEMRRMWDSIRDPFGSGNSWTPPVESRGMFGSSAKNFFGASEETTRAHEASADDVPEEGESLVDEDRGESQRHPGTGGDLELPLELTLAEVLTGVVRTVRFSVTEPLTGESERREVQVRIPVGIRPDVRLRVAGKGIPGRNGGGPGDLKLWVRWLEHPNLSPDGDDLVMRIKLRPEVAARGAMLQVNGLEGPLQFRVPAGVTADQTLRIRGQGLPRAEAPGSRGDLRMRVLISTDV